MSTGSPTAYLLWAILSCIFLGFLILHLWLYDRFNCLKWDSGRQPGAFKRVMTYSYLATLPLLVVFSVAMTALKFKEGFILASDGRIIPRPFTDWSPDSRRHILPLIFVLSTAWSLELVTHLEELTFWLFLLHQGPGKRDWFHSWEYRTWYLGSIVAVLGMPVTTVVTRHLQNSQLAWVFLVGSGAGTTTTVCFLYVLFRFPAFLEHVKSEGADPDVVVRLTTFYQLNCMRVAFRFIFTVPMLIIALDSIEGPFPIVSNAFALDFLMMVGGIGCFISSGITLLIFFPRSVAQESGYSAKIISPQTSAKPGLSSQPPEYSHHDHHHYNHHYQEDLALSANPISMLGYPGSPASTDHMHGFRFPPGPNHLPIENYDRSSLPGRRRDSADSGDLSLGYDFDAESIAMTSQTIEGHPIQHSVSQPAHSRGPSGKASGGDKSDDTVWEGRHPEDGLRGSTSVRRHSDGPFVYNRNGKLARVNSGGGGRASRDVIRTSQLHPYLVNFTSPIDLMDGRDDDRVSPA